MTHVLERDLTVCTRSYEFEIRSADRSGRRLVGRVAAFNKRTRIPDRNGDFEEELMPGFADRSLREHGMPVMQFDHGKDPRVGTVPIGVYETFERSQGGYDVEGELFDNALVEPVRQAIQAGAIKGMSFRFHVSKKGDRWERRAGQMDLRQVVDADVPEAGPVVFPAYKDTAVAVRALWATYDEEEREELRRLAGISTDLAGRPTTRSGGGGDPDAEPREGDASPRTEAQLARRRLLNSLPQPSLR
jgi:HK97 family phage prohead protease